MPGVFSYYCFLHGMESRDDNDDDGDNDDDDDNDDGDDNDGNDDDDEYDGDDDDSDEGLSYMFCVHVCASLQCTLRIRNNY